MAFLKSWKEREKFMDLMVERALDADEEKSEEYSSALCIQRWFRGCRVRAYLKHLHDNAIIIQSHYRGYLGRAEHRRRLKKRLNVMRNSHYYVKATMIQSLWRGYYVRRFVFNYRAYRDYMNALIVKNEIVRTRLKEEGERSEYERSLKEEENQELRAQDEARRYHYLLSTKAKDGVFKEFGTSVSHPFEDRMRSIKFTPPLRDRLKRRPHKDLLPTTTAAITTTMMDGSLPPLVRVQGPFKSPEEARSLKYQPLRPTLRVSTDYNSVEIARSELKAEEWRKRLIEEKFIPFSHGTGSYEPLLHSSGAYGTLPYGTLHYRERHPEGDVTTAMFRTTVPTIPTFDNLKA